jgi:hypothetical protein
MQELMPELRRLRVIHLPKTIDNDYYGIDWTFGFFSAAHFAAAEIRNLGADARSTKVWYVLEIMGRKAGWLTYASGIAGEATRMLSVEDFDGEFDVRGAEEMVELMLTASTTDAGTASSAWPRGSPTGFPTTSVPRAWTSTATSSSARRSRQGCSPRRWSARTRARKVRHKQIGYETGARSRARSTCCSARSSASVRTGRSSRRGFRATW